MSRPEFGRGPEFEDTDVEDGAEAEEVISGVQEAIFAAVDLTPENSSVLSEILDQARATYDNDSKAWDQLFSNLTSELTAASDDDEATDILHQYKRKGAALV